MLVSVSLIFTLEDIYKFTECGDGECQKVEACYECPDENTAKGGQRALPCTACPQDCCPVQHYFVEYFFTLIFLLILILTPVGIFVTICLVSLPQFVDCDTINF